MNRHIASLLAALLLVTAAGNAAGATDAAKPGSLSGAVDPVYIDSTDILYLESFPVQVVLVVRGSLPTPCHRISSDVQASDDHINVAVWSVADPDEICIQVLEAFEVSIPLGDFESADLAVFVNGEAVGRIEIGTTPTGGALTLAGAGWSYGLCLGYCLADLEINGQDVVASGRDRGDAQALYQNKGTLTQFGLDQLEAALAAVASIPLDDVYGCPDCADGGAAYLVLTDGRTTSRVEMQANQPPDFLAAPVEVATSLISALATCTSNELVTIDDACAPNPRS